MSGGYAAVYNVVFTKLVSLTSGCETAFRLGLQVLHGLGWTLNESTLVHATQQVAWLGWIVDLQQQVASHAFVPCKEAVMVGDRPGDGSRRVPVLSMQGSVVSSPTAWKSRRGWDGVTVPSATGRRVEDAQVASVCKT